MKFNADHAFHIGAQHLRSGLPCQDYAVSATADGYAFGIISDGCSSGGETDIGSRVIARSTANALHRSARHFFDQDMVDGYCRASDAVGRSGLSLEHNDMLATCGYIAAYKGGLTVRLIGDGVIAGRFRGGKLIAIKLEWANNTPVYRAYADDNYCAFKRGHGGEGAMAVTVTRHTRKADAQSNTQFAQPLYNMIDGFSDRMSAQDFEFVAVFSDGITQIDGVDWRDAVAEIMNFKSKEGSFVKRRTNRFLKSLGIRQPLDDISVAAIHIDHEVA